MSIIKKLLDSSIWIIFFFCVTFSLLTVVAQNALPGDTFYGFKLAYEKVLFAASRFINRQVDLQIEYVGRRFNESSQVLTSKHGKESLDRLDKEVLSTADTISMIQDPTQKQQAAKKYISQLNSISTGLVEQKQIITTNAAPAASPTTTATAVNTSEISQQIDTTQSTIQQTINQMENITQESASPTPAPTNTPVPTATSTPMPTIPPTATPTAVPTTEPTSTPTTAPTPANPNSCSLYNPLYISVSQEGEQKCNICGSYSECKANHPNETYYKDQSGGVNPDCSQTCDKD
ncbi:MAG: hypothetical protein ACOYUB_00240 [Patescibacteria group bacterium]